MTPWIFSPPQGDTGWHPPRVAPERAANAALVTVLALLGAACGGGYTTYGQPLAGAGHLVVLLHGYGAPGDDLRGLAIDLKHGGAPADTAYVIAEGLQHRGSGLAWFSTAEEAPGAMEHVERLLTTLMKKARLSSDKVALVGFSQGALVALQVALQARVPVGRVVAISAPALLKPPRPGAAAGTAFLVIHGEGDGVVPVSAARATTAALLAAGLSCQALLHPGAHDIPNEARLAAARFLADGERRPP